MQVVETSHWAHVCGVTQSLQAEQHLWVSCHVVSPPVSVPSVWYPSACRRKERTKSVEEAKFSESSLKPSWCSLQNFSCESRSVAWQAGTVQGMN